MQQDNDAPQADGLSSLRDEAGKPSSPKASIPSAGDLRIWWVPQLPMKAFEVDVPDLASAVLVANILASYDAFQFENGVKPDYCNVGGLIEYDADAADWTDWECPVSFDEFEEIRISPAKLASAIEARSHIKQGAGE